MFVLRLPYYLWVLVLYTHLLLQSVFGQEANLNLKKNDQTQTSIIFAVTPQGQFGFLFYVVQFNVKSKL